MTGRTSFRNVSNKVELIDMYSSDVHFSSTFYMTISERFDTLSSLVTFMLLLCSIRAWVRFDLSETGN